MINRSKQTNDIFQKITTFAAEKRHKYDTKTRYKTDYHRFGMVA